MFCHFTRYFFLKFIAKSVLREDFFGFPDFHFVQRLDLFVFTFLFRIVMFNLGSPREVAAQSHGDGPGRNFGKTCSNNDGG